MKSTNERRSQFKDDEIVVYDISQIKIKYLIEYGPQSTTTTIQTTNSSSKISSIPQMLPQQQLPMPVSPSFSQITKNFKKETKLGLIAGDVVLPLQSVIVKAKILDLASEIVIFQTFRNNSSMFLLYLFSCIFLI